MASFHGKESFGTFRELAAEQHVPALALAVRTEYVDLIELLADDGALARRLVVERYCLAAGIGVFALVLTQCR